MNQTLIDGKIKDKQLLTPKQVGQKTSSSVSNFQFRSPYYLLAMFHLLISMIWEILVLYKCLCGIFFQVFIACGFSNKGQNADAYRKPSIGMWTLLKEHFNSGVAIDMHQLLFFPLSHRDLNSLNSVLYGTYYLLIFFSEVLSGFLMPCLQIKMIIGTCINLFFIDHSMWEMQQEGLVIIVMQTQNLQRYDFTFLVSALFLILEMKICFH